MKRRSALWLALLAAAVAMAACAGETTEASDGPSPTPMPGGRGETTCSATGLSAEMADQPGLPAPVAHTRQAIAEAAVACDYGALEGLALSSGTFTYSFGGGGEPAAFWREGESVGEEPMALLVQLLDLPFAKEGRFYTWPSAASARPSEEDWQALKPVFTEEEIAQWKDLGAYIGYRVGITAEGGWTFYVAGD